MGNSGSIINQQSTSNPSPSRQKLSSGFERQWMNIQLNQIFDSEFLKKQSFQSGFTKTKLFRTRSKQNLNGTCHSELMRDIEGNLLQDSDSIADALISFSNTDAAMRMSYNVNRLAHGSILQCQLNQPFNTILHLRLHVLKCLHQVLDSQSHRFEQFGPEQVRKLLTQISSSQNEQSSEDDIMDACSCAEMSSSILLSSTSTSEIDILSRNAELGMMVFVLMLESIFEGSGSEESNQEEREFEFLPDIAEVMKELTPLSLKDSFINHSSMNTSSNLSAASTSTCNANPSTCVSCRIQSLVRLIRCRRDISFTSHISTMKKNENAKMDAQYVLNVVQEYLLRIVLRDEEEKKEKQVKEEESKNPLSREDSPSTLVPNSSPSGEDSPLSPLEEQQKDNMTQALQCLLQLAIARGSFLDFLRAFHLMFGVGKMQFERKQELYQQLNEVYLKTMTTPNYDENLMHLKRTVSPTQTLVLLNDGEINVNNPLETNMFDQKVTNVRIKPPLPSQSEETSPKNQSMTKRNKKEMLREEEKKLLQLEEAIEKQQEEQQFLDNESADMNLCGPLKIDFLLNHLCQVKARSIPYNFLETSLEPREVWTCGQNSYGELGHGDSISRKIFGQIKFNSTSNPQIIQVCAGNEHTIALDADGVVYSVGYNDNGQCGHGSTSRINQLTPIETLKGQVVNQIHSYNGSEHSIIVTEAGRIASFGYNYRGQLGT